MNQCSRCLLAYQEDCSDSLEVQRHDSTVGRAIRYQLCPPCGKLLDDWMREQSEYTASLLRGIHDEKPKKPAVRGSGHFENYGGSWGE